jgi:Integrase core domain
VSTGQSASVPMLPAPFQFLIAMVAYTINERMARSVSARRSRVSKRLAAATGKTRIDFNAEQRRRLALKGKELTAEERRACCQIVRPQTILAWFRQLAAQRYDSSKVRKAADQSHWETLYACDFFGVEVLGLFGTVRTMVFFVIELKSRAVHIAGVRIAPDGDWMKQTARNLLDPVDGFLRHATHLVHDRDPLFTQAWTALLQTSCVKCVPIPAQSPNCNPHAERFVKTVRSECLDHFVIFGERHLRHLVTEFVAHYLTERYHQGIGSQIIKPQPSPSNDNASLDAIAWRPRLGGLLNYYCREAA